MSEAREDTYEDAIADKRFMAWLEKYDGSWDLCYSGEILNMYNAWYAGYLHGSRTTAEDLS